MLPPTLGRWRQSGCPGAPARFQARVGKHFWKKFGALRARVLHQP